MWLIFLANALFASTYTLGKILLHSMQPSYLIGFRMTIAGLLLLIIIYWIKPQYFFIKKRFLWPLLQIAFFNLYLSYVLEFWALQYMSSIKVTLLYNLAPFVSAFYAYLWSHERMTTKKWLGLIIGFMGVMPVLFSSSSSEDVLQALWIISWPELAIIASVFAYCYGWVLIQNLAVKEKYPTMMISAVSMLGGGIIALLSALFLDTWLPLDNPYEFSGLLLLLIIIGNLICHNLFTLSLKKYSVTLLTFSGLTIPIFTAIFGYMFLGEKATWDLVISTAIVCYGLYLFYQEEFKEAVRDIKL